MKKILFACAVAAAAIAVGTTNSTGASRQAGTQVNTYAVNDTIPKKDTIKRDTNAFAFNALDTIPKKDTVKRDTTSYALLAKN